MLRCPALECNNVDAQMTEQKSDLHGALDGRIHRGIGAFAVVNKAATTKGK
jgi:hypothetical protein